MVSASMADDCEAAHAYHATSTGRRNVSRHCSPGPTVETVSEPQTSLQKYFGKPVPGPAAVRSTPAPATPPRARSATNGAASTGKKAKRDLPTTSKKSKVRLPQKSKVRFSPKRRMAAWGRLSSGAKLRPRSAYQLFAKDNRKKIQTELGTTDFATVSRAVGERWAALSFQEKTPFEKRQKEMSAKFAKVRAGYKEYAHDVAKLKKAETPQAPKRQPKPDSAEGGKEGRGASWPISFGGAALPGDCR